MKIGAELINRAAPPGIIRVCERILSPASIFSRQGLDMIPITGINNSVPVHLLVLVVLKQS